MSFASVCKRVVVEKDEHNVFPALKQSCRKTLVVTSCFPRPDEDFHFWEPFIQSSGASISGVTKRKSAAITAWAVPLEEPLASVISSSQNDKIRAHLAGDTINSVFKRHRRMKNYLFYTEVGEEWC